MLISQRWVRNATAGALGAAAVAGAMLFGGDATAQAAPVPGASFATVGLHGGPGGIVPERLGGFGHGGFGHGGFGHRGLGRGGFGRGGMGRHGGFGRHAGFGRRGGFGRYGWRHGGFGHRGMLGNREAWWWY